MGSRGSNLIHSPNEPDLEAAVANLYIRRGVKRVSASAYMNLTLQWFATLTRDYGNCVTDKLTEKSRLCQDFSA